jgi:HEAT repeat protein
MRRLKPFSILDFRFAIWESKIKNQKSKILSFVYCVLCMVSLPCIGGTGDDLMAIRELLLTLEQGYEERDVEKYVSVFSDEEYEYISDMTTPDDPSDDIRLLGAESERRAAIRVFGAYKNIDLETTDPEITMDGDSAEARNEIEIVFVGFENPHVPAVYYAASLNTFSLRRIKGKWRIARWQQHEMSVEELASRKQEERKNKGLEDLIRDLGDDRLGTWVAAIAALRKAHRTAAEPLIDAVAHDPSKDVRIRAAKVLCGTRNEDAVQALIEILEDEEDDVDVRVAAVDALSECDSQAADRSLLIAAKRSEPKLKSAACLALARRIRKKMDDVYRIAVMGFTSHDEAVREAAAESLGIIGSQKGANLLEQRLRDRDESQNVRLAALESLRQLGVRTESTLRFFRDMLKDETETVQIRTHAARALAEAKDHRALELLIDVAKDEEETLELRKEAITALGATGDSKAAKPLIGLLNRRLDTDLRREVVRTLQRLGDRRALKPLMMVLMNRDEDIFVRRLAGGGIVKIDQDIAFGPLVQIMNDKTENAPARRMAAEILASSKDGRSITSLIEVLEDEQQPWWLRRIVIDHLGSFRSSAPCIEALEAVADDADERIAKVARNALREIDTKALANP